jgi:hypothetical protein
LVGGNVFGNISHFDYPEQFDRNAGTGRKSPRIRQHVLRRVRAV